MWLLLILLVPILAGCRSVERDSHDFHAVNRTDWHLRVDSIVLHDSVFIREKSDTVFFTKYRTIYKERLLRDTVVRCDTVYVEREITVEKKDVLQLWPFVAAVLLLLLWRSGAFGLLRKLLFGI